MSCSEIVNQKTAHDTTHVSIFLWGGGGEREGERETTIMVNCHREKLWLGSLHQVCFD